VVKEVKGEELIFEFNEPGDFWDADKFEMVEAAPLVERPVSLVNISDALTPKTSATSDPFTTQVMTSNTNPFKVGDKVRIKPVYQYKHGWPYGSDVITVTCVDKFSIMVSPYSWWDAYRFEFALEPSDTKTPSKTDDPFTTQVGGDHYKSMGIQPIDYITANNLPFIEGNIVKYITRWKQKGGVQDIDKVIHYAEMLRALELKKVSSDV
jgi:hypothetical protein